MCRRRPCPVYHIKPKKPVQFLGRALWFRAAAYSPGLGPVPSARQGLTSLFGMGRGGAPALGRPIVALAGLSPAAMPFHDMSCRDRNAARSTGQAYGQLVPLGFAVAGCTPAAYRRRRLRRPLFGSLISGWASHLDAFSAYPCPTWLPGGAVGTTAGTPAVGPARSSRTKASSPQASRARNR